MLDKLENNEKIILDYISNLSKNSILSRVIQDRYCFSEFFEMRVTFIGSFRDITYVYYLKQPLPLCEIKLNQILAKNWRLINRLYRYLSNPYIRNIAHQEIKFFNKRNRALIL